MADGGGNMYWVIPVVILLSGALVIAGYGFDRSANKTDFYGSYRYPEHILNDQRMYMKQVRWRYQMAMMKANGIRVSQSGYP